MPESRLGRSTHRLAWINVFTYIHWGGLASLNHFFIFFILPSYRYTTTPVILLSTSIMRNFQWNWHCIFYDVQCTTPNWSYRLFGVDSSLTSIYAKSGRLFATVVIINQLVDVVNVLYAHFESYANNETMKIYCNNVRVNLFSKAHCVCIIKGMNERDHNCNTDVRSFPGDILSFNIQRHRRNREVACERRGRGQQGRSCS